MRIYISLCVLIWTLQAAYAAITEANLKTFPNSFALEHPFNGVRDLYWTGMKTHRRVCFAASPSGTIGFVAYLDASERGVHVQQVDLQSFKAIGKAFTVPDGREAGGLVVPEDEDGFALLTNEALSPDTTDAPKDGTPIPVLYRVEGGKLSWKTYLAGPGIHPEEGLGQAVDMNGDLTWSPVKKLFAAYFVISYYTGEHAGHFADSIQYVDPQGKIQIIKGATSGGGCSHNTGIAFASADDAPYCSACSEDQQGGVWLNTKTQNAGPPSPLLSKEPFINGMSGEPFNGMGGSWRVLGRLADTQQYAITWLTRNTQLPKSESGGETEPGNPPPSKKQPTTKTSTGTNIDPNAVNPKGTRLQQTTDQQTKENTARLRFVRRQTTKKTNENPKVPPKTPQGTTETPEKTTHTTSPTGDEGGGVAPQELTETTHTTGGGGQGGGKAGGQGGEGGVAPPRNVAIAILKDKYTVATKNIITKGPADHFNVHVQAFDSETILSTYEEITSPKCVKAAGCMGTFAGTYFAQVDTTAKVVGQPFKSTEITVGGDLVLLPSGSICFPYVDMKWDYSAKYDKSGVGQQTTLADSKTTEDKENPATKTQTGGTTRFGRLFRRQSITTDEKTPETHNNNNNGPPPPKAGGQGGGGVRLQRVDENGTPPLNGGVKGGGKGGGKGSGKGGGGVQLQKIDVSGTPGTQQLSFACVSSPNEAGGTTNADSNPKTEVSPDVKTEGAGNQGNVKKPANTKLLETENQDESTTPQDTTTTHNNALHRSRLRRFLGKFS
ncbi:hypothetical protein BKA81DRAFT_408016 [Phyllosticta paracitricarpa]